MGQATSSSAGGDQFPADTEMFLPDGGSLGPGRPDMQAKKFKHPMAALFHVIFKILSISIYLFGGLFGQDFSSIFVSVMLLISMDFWVVKNVTGRLLAGLRWSNYIDDEGNSHWIFENKNASKDSTDEDKFNSLREEIGGQMGTADQSIFWSALIISPSIWTLLLLITIFRLNVQWLMLVVLATTFSYSNLFGYVRCRVGTSDVKSSVTKYLAKQFLFNYFSGKSSSTTAKSVA